MSDRSFGSFLAIVGRLETTIIKLGIVDEYIARPSLRNNYDCAYRWWYEG